MLKTMSQGRKYVLFFACLGFFIIIFACSVLLFSEKKCFLALCVKVSASNINRDTWIQKDNSSFTAVEIKTK